MNLNKKITIPNNLTKEVFILTINCEKETKVKFSSYLRTALFRKFKALFVTQDLSLSDFENLEAKKYKSTRHHWGSYNG
jgi:hypothetical protein